MREAKLKQVIVVRTDLQMGKGKIGVQVAHGAVSAALEVQRQNPRWLRSWIDQGQPKITVRVHGIEELSALRAGAASAGLPAVLVEDRGLTQLPSGTPTCLAIGPGPVERIDHLTGHLKLL
jgi:PTH2 family peptidyl-tRNA hydrolase